MAEKIKRISIDAFEKAIKSFYKPVELVEWNGITLAIRRHLGLSDIAKFVDVCTKACFNPDTEAYTPEAKDLAIRSCMVIWYTNLSLPSNLEKQYELIYHSGITDTISQHIDTVQFKAIIDAIDDKIDNLASANVELINKQMNELYTSFETIQKQMADMFDNISPEDIKGAVSALSNGAIDEEKLVKAYMNAKE